MRGSIWFLIIVCMILAITGLVNAESQSQIIKEIIVVGETRTEEQLIFDLLPYSVGDVWQDSYKAWSLNRLTGLGIFNNGSLRVVVEPLEEEEVRIVIRVSDPGLFYTEALWYLIEQITDVTAKQFNQTVYNPFGNGLNLSFGFQWGGVKYYRGGITGIITDGWNYATSYTEYDFPVNYGDQGLFQLSGHQFRVSADNYFLPYWKSGLSLIYYYANLDSAQSKIPEKYLVIGSDLKYTQFGVLNLRGRYFIDLIGQPSLWKVTFDYTCEQNLTDKNYLVFALRGGICDLNTPPNLQFNGGGFGDLLLRGSSSFMGKAYGIMNLELRQKVSSNLWVIGFSDLGTFTDLAVETDLSIEKNVGVGVAYDTPIGMPVRVDFAWSLNSGGFAWNWGMGHSF